MVLSIIQCRLGSTRFPRKALADLHCRPVIAHVVERAGQIRGVDKVVVAVPSVDYSALEPIFVDIGIWGAVPSGELVAIDGDASDVLNRFSRIAAENTRHDTIMRLTGDCPLLEPLVCERVLDLYRLAKCEYAWTDTPRGDWPDGLDCEVFSRRLLEQCADVARDPADREHVTSWMRRNAMTVSLRPDPKYQGWPKLSIDTPEDLERVRAWQWKPVISK